MQSFEIPILNVSRNIHLFDGYGKYLGGAYQNDPGHITLAMFYDMCEHFLRFPSPKFRWNVHRLEERRTFGDPLPKDGCLIKEGAYVVLGNERQVVDITLTDDESIRRITTHQPSTHKLEDNQRHFRDCLRERDQRCVITGFEGPPEDPFLGLDAVHIFPVARLAIWGANGYSNWIRDTCPPKIIGPDKVSSVQNGLLMSRLVHVLFDSLNFSINPDEGHKIVCFTVDQANIGGKTLSPTTRSNSSTNTNTDSRVSDDALRWHYRQAILMHMKGTGARSWDLDYAGSNEMNVIMGEPDAPEIMEVELGNRLTGQIEE